MGHQRTPLGLGLALSLTLGAVNGTAAAQAAGASGCPPAITVQAAQTPEQREALAPALLHCLSERDPKLRDQLGFDTLSAWLRGGHLGVSARQRLWSELDALWQAEDNGVRRSFILLTLAELARTDRVSPWLSDSERLRLLEQALERVRQWTDYRDFDDTVGWRHGVAHGADLLLQLALHPQRSPAEQARILAVLGQHVLAGGQLAYQAGEGTRLARASWVALTRSGWDGAAWAAHLQGLAAPLQSQTTWSRARLIHLHNWREFLLPLYVLIQEQPDAALRERYLPALREQLRPVL